MKISIVTACYNAADTIERTIQSIREQGYNDLQYIVIDGDSTDGTQEVIQRHLDFIDVYISEPDKGVCEALNKGFKYADGEIFAYLNADDCLMPGALNFIAEAFEASPEIDVITGGCRRIFADGSEYTTQVPDRYLRAMAWRNDIEQPSTFWRAKVHHLAGDFDENLKLAFDWEYWNRLAKSGAAFKAVPEVLSIYYFSDTNLTSRGGISVIREMRDITARYHGKGLAFAYMVIFHLVDMRGLLDGRNLNWFARAWSKSVFTVLGFLFGREAIHHYNWNWASKQVRGLVWYK